MVIFSIIFSKYVALRCFFYGKAKDKKWWMELKRNAICDIKAEVGTR